MLYVYAYPDAMQGHRFTDDVAITFATSKEKAVKKFQRYYGDNNLARSVREIDLKRLFSDVCILTDY